MQLLAGVYLIASALIEADMVSGGSLEAHRTQCTRLVSAMDLTEPLTAQLVSNFSSAKPEQSPDDESAMRAFEWLLTQWRMPTAETRARLAAEAEAMGAEAVAARRSDMYEAQLSREVSGVLEQWMPTLETNAAQEDGEVLELLLRQLGYPTTLSTR